MGGVYFAGLEMPTSCMGCGFRDAEYEGDCCLMPQADFEDYDAQFSVCPIKEIAHYYPPTIVPRDAVVTSFKYEVDVAIRRK